MIIKNMKLIMLKSKIHRAVVTGAELEYDGSLEIDETLINAAGLLPYEQVQIYNITNGNRFTTYVIKGKKDSGIICVNGAAARLASKGDLLIITSYAEIDKEEAKDLVPAVVKVDRENRLLMSC